MASLLRSVSFALLSLVASACARNAVLEMEIGVPPQPAGPLRFAVVQVETDAQPFEGDWVSSNDYAGAPLQATPQVVRYSVVSEDPDTVVQVKVSFCTTEDCSALEDAADRTPGLWYRLERSLYIGQRTRWSPVIDAVPADPPVEPIEVDKCAIEGCIRADGSETSFCRLSGEHFCESSP